MKPEHKKRLGKAIAFVLVWIPVAIWFHIEPMICIATIGTLALWDRINRPPSPEPAARQ